MYATEAEDQEALDIAIAMSLSQQEQSGKGGPPTALPILQGMQGTPVDVEMAGVSPHSSPGTGTGGQYLLPVTTAVPSDGYGYRNHNPPPPPREEESSWISSFVPMPRLPPDHSRRTYRDDIPHSGSDTPPAMDDWTLAHMLQQMEFEMPEETAEMRRERDEDGDFEEKEYNASSCGRQLTTLSTLICFAQVVMFIAMVSSAGLAPRSENSMIGPSVITLVNWGAKDAALMVYKGQWWRLFTPIMLHGGWLHLLSNVLIQLRVGGYLNLVFTTPKWGAIYLISGTFGNICSCLFLPDSVSVGSSGAVLGMLTAWLVWIVYRWKKVPHEAKGQRNCQLGVVAVAVAVTLAFSFSPFVDYGAHFGGAIMGLLTAAVLLASELDDLRNQCLVRTVALAIACCLWSVSIYYLSILRPSKVMMEYWEDNDQIK